jgi:hypothetical protein
MLLRKINDCASPIVALIRLALSMGIHPKQMGLVCRFVWMLGQM